MDGHGLQGLIDTDSDVSLISERFRILFKHKISRRPLIIKGITAEALEVSEQFRTKVKITGKSTELVFIIVPDGMLDFDVLIGCNLLHDSELFTVTDHIGTERSFCVCR
jgi:hypothetical protein